MTTLTKECVKHTPFVPAISFVSTNASDLGTEYTFCEVCEQDISRFMTEDPDRGHYFTRWSVK